MDRRPIVDLPPRAPTTRAGLAALCTAALDDAACREGTPRTGTEPVGPAAAHALLLLTPPWRGAVLAFGALDAAGALAGFGRLALPPAAPGRRAGPPVAHLDLTVHPARRGEGIGRALLDEALRTAARHGAHLVVEGPPSAAALRLAARARLAVARCEVRAVRDALLPCPPPEAPDGCVALSWRDRCPAPLLGAYGRILALVQEEAAPMPPAEIRYHERAALAAGLRCQTVALLDRADGELVAVSTARVVAGRTAEQAETVVLPPLRGRGLGHVVKAALLHAVRRAEPRLRRFETYTARDNAPMRAVNADLGFAPVADHLVWCGTP